MAKCKNEMYFLEIIGHYFLTANEFLCCHSDFIWVGGTLLDKTGYSKIQNSEDFIYILYNIIFNCIKFHINLEVSFIFWIFKQMLRKICDFNGFSRMNNSWTGPKVCPNHNQLCPVVLARLENKIFFFGFDRYRIYFNRAL